jgi:hypothetical protein
MTSSRHRYRQTERIVPRLSFAHSQRGRTSTGWNRRIANRSHPLTPPGPPCSHYMPQKGRRSSFSFPRAPMGSPGGREPAWTRRRRLLFPGKFCLPELDPASAVQSSVRRPVSLEAGRDQQQHRTRWANRSLTPARLAATRCRGPAQWAPSEPRTPTHISGRRRVLVMPLSAKCGRCT